MIKAETSSRAETAFVLLLLQSAFWGIAGLSALPFAIAGETFMAVLGTITLLLALGTLLAAIGVLWRRRWARRMIIALEVLCVVGALIQLALPIGGNHGLVSMLVNVCLPVAVLALLRKPRDDFR